MWTGVQAPAPLTALPHVTPSHRTSRRALRSVCRAHQGQSETPESCQGKGASHATGAGLTRRAALLTVACTSLVAAPMVAQAEIPAPQFQPAVPGPTILPAQSSQQLGFVSKVQEFTLDNGLHFIVLPRDVAPVVSVHVLANVGAFQEEEGQTGLAHLLEHMAFKGTRRIGARDWKQEAPLLDAMDEVFYELRELRNSGSSGTVTAARIQQLEDKMKQLQADASALIVPNAYGATLTQAGGVGLNATTSHDDTRYFVSLPSNKLELWFAMESERFRAPVFRELYSEKKVIEEERRLRVDDAPLGRFQQEFATRALTNNYRRPVIGWEQDFAGLGRKEVVDFFAKHYGPSNLTIAIVGDTTPEQVHRWAVQYWGSWAGSQARPAAGSTTPIDTMVAGTPPIAQTKRLASLALPGQPLYATALIPSFPASTSATTTAAAAAAAAGATCSPSGFKPSGQPCYADTSVGGPLVMLGYPRPSLTSDIGSTIQVMSDLLSGSRTARLTGRLLLQRQALRGIRCIPSYPGERYEGMVLLAAQPLQGQRPEAAEKLVVEELDRFVQEGPSASELQRVQKATRTSVLASALSNSAMASLLASYHNATGSWRGLLSELDEVAALKPQGVQSVAQLILNKDKMFTGYVYAK